MQSIVEIHNSNVQFVLAVSGGGTETISRLLTTPGASRSILEAIVPYSDKAMERFLGMTPEQACSERNARAMAMAAYLRAIQMSPASNSKTVAGIACTAALATDRPRRGSHQVYIALQTNTLTRSLSLTLKKGLRSREEEECVASNLLLLAICELCEVSYDGNLDLSAEERVIREVAIADAPTQELFTGKLDILSVGNVHPEAKPLTVFPGAFNPLHSGHRKIAGIASQLTGNATHLELSIINVDKLPLDYMEIEHRRQRISSELPLQLTRAPTFVEKSALFPGATFVVGIDTMMRITHRRYYNNDTRATTKALRTIRKNGCKFLVFGREVDGKFYSLHDIDLPDLVADICTAVPERDFHMNISSTAERAREMKRKPKH